VKNIQIIDDADNCTYDVFQVSNSEFELIFPSDGQDIEFIEDLLERFDTKIFSVFQEKLWRNPIEKNEVSGINGTLFYNLSRRKKYYPTKRFSEAILPFDEL